MNNSYLNLEEGWDEDFDPGEFTQFVENVATDAVNKLKSVAGEDIDLSEMKANQYAQQFNNENFGQVGVEGDQKLTWTGDRVQSAIDARKKYFENRKFDMKIHPEKYEALVALRKKNYQNMMEKIRNNPEALEAFNKANAERQAKYQNKFKKRIFEIQEELKKTMGPTKRQELETELALLLRQHEKVKSNQSKHDKKKREKIESDTFEGLTAKLMSSIANVKMGIKKKITAKLKSEENTLFKPFMDKIVDAQARGDTAGVAMATKILQKALNQAAENDPELVSYNSESTKYNQLRDMLEMVNKQGWMDPEISLEEIGPHLQAVLETGKGILSDRSKVFRSPNNTLSEIVTLLEKRLSNKNAIASGNKRNIMNKSSRAKALEKIIKQAELDKKAQEAITSAEDSKGKEFAHKIFEALVDNLKIEGLDD